MGSVSFRASRISGRHEPYMVIAVMSCLFIHTTTNRHQAKVIPKPSWQSCVTTSLAMTSCLKDKVDCRCARIGHKPKGCVSCVRFDCLRGYRPQSRANTPGKQHHTLHRRKEQWYGKSLPSLSHASMDFEQRTGVERRHKMWFDRVYPMLNNNNNNNNMS